jgi:oligopeptide transport system permease protein
MIGRSLWQDARNRLMRNRAAIASLIVLGLMALGCIAGPWLTGHPYDRVYPDYVRVPASLESYPKAEAIPAAVQRIAARIRATPGDVAVAGESLLMTLTSQRPIDQRLLVYFDRSDQFGTPRITANEEDGRRLALEVPLKRQRFLFGTDNTGRDLLTRTLIAGRISLAIGLLAGVVAVVIGVVYGAAAGYLRRQSTM